MLKFLDALYGNIGGKIKTLAKILFVVEAIAAVITGLVLAAYDIIYIFILPAGPVVAFVTSWILYAFGELVEKTSDNEANTRAIVGLLEEKESAERKEEKKSSSASSVTEKKQGTRAPEKVIPQADNRSKKTSYVANDDGTITCSACNFEQPASRKVCWHCGAEFE